MKTWKLEELEAIAQEIVDKAKEASEGFFTHDTHNVYLDCTYTADYTDVKYYPDSGYEGGDLCGLELYNIDGCWYDEDKNESNITDVTDEEKQILQDTVNKLIH